MTIHSVSGTSQSSDPPRGQLVAKLAMTDYGTIPDGRLSFESPASLNFELDSGSTGIISKLAGTRTVSGSLWIHFTVSGGSYNLLIQAIVIRPKPGNPPDTIVTTTFAHKVGQGDPGHIETIPLALYRVEMKYNDRLEFKIETVTDMGEVITVNPHMSVDLSDTIVVHTDT